MMMTKEELCSISGVSREILDNGLERITLNGDVTDHLPCQLKLYGLTLQGCISLQSLPEDLDIKYLSIRQCPGIVRLPESLQLEQLYLFQSEIDVLPVHSSCWKELVLIDCPNIRRIPDVCTAFAGDLFLEGCKNLESLPAIKSVYGDLNIARTSIRHLPENIIIGNDLEAYCSDIETLPGNSRIGGNICLSGCKNLKSLPDGLVVNGDLDLNESSLTELPDRLIVECSGHDLSVKRSVRDDLREEDNCILAIRSENIAIVPEDNMENRFIRADDVAQELNVSKPYAYKLIRKLNEELKKLPACNWKGKKVVTSGIICDNPNLLQIFDDNKIAIVADDVAHESRPLRVDAAETGDPMMALAQQFANQDYDVLLYDEESNQNRRGEFVAKMVKDSGAQGLILFMQQFCDPEEMEYPYLKKALDDAGIPHIKLGVDQQMRDFGQASTAIQAFADVL